MISLIEQRLHHANAWELPVKNAECKKDKDQVPHALAIHHQLHLNHQTELDAHVMDLDSVKLAKTRSKDQVLLALAIHQALHPNHQMEPDALVMVLDSAKLANKTRITRDAHAETLDFAKFAKQKRTRSITLFNTPIIWDTQLTSIHTSQDNSHQTSTSNKEVSALNGTWMAPLEDSETINTDLVSVPVNKPSTNNSGTSTKCQEPSELIQETTLSSPTLKETTGAKKNTELS